MWMSQHTGRQRRNTAQPMPHPAPSRRPKHPIPALYPQKWWPSGPCHCCCCCRGCCCPPLGLCSCARKPPRCRRQIKWLTWGGSWRCSSVSLQPVICLPPVFKGAFGGAEWSPVVRVTQPPLFCTSSLGAVVFVQRWPGTRVCSRGVVSPP